MAPVALEIDFFLFNHATNSYFGRGQVTAVADQTVAVVEDAARNFIMERAQSNVAVRINRVMEVFELKVPLRQYLMILQPRKSLSQACKRDSRQLEEYNREINASSESITRHETSASLQRIRTKDSLFNPGL